LLILGQDCHADSFDSRVFLAYLLALVGVPMARRAALDFGVVDRPDGNLKNHREPVPYLGGLAVFIAFLGPHLYGVICHIVDFFSQ